MKGRNGCEHGFWRGYCGKTRARSERGKSCHRCSARFAERSADDQHVSVAAFVGVTRSGREQRREIEGSTQMKSELRDGGLWRRTDGRDHGGTGGQPRENVRWTRSGKG